MKPTSMFCGACGWTGDIAKKQSRSQYRKSKLGCPGCGHKMAPLATRSKLAKPGQVIQPMDHVITKLLKKAAALPRQNKPS